MKKYSVPMDFRNDSFHFLIKAFQNLYPDIEFEVFWDNALGKKEGHHVPNKPAHTYFIRHGKALVFISASITVEEAIEVLADELVYVVVRTRKKSDFRWLMTKQNIRREYLIVGKRAQKKWRKRYGRFD